MVAEGRNTTSSMRSSQPETCHLGLMCLLPCKLAWAPHSCLRCSFPAVGHFGRDPEIFAERKVFSTGRGFLKHIKSEGFFSTGNTTDLLCAFLHENCTDNTRRLVVLRLWLSTIPSLAMPADPRTSCSSSSFPADRGNPCCKGGSRLCCCPLMLPVLFGMLVPCFSNEAKGSPALLTFPLAR